MEKLVLPHYFIIYHFKKNKEINRNFNNLIIDYFFEYINNINYL